MSKILVTGASGQLGRRTLQHLLERRPAADLVGLARDPDKAADLAAAGIEIRRGDYLEPDTLRDAFADVEQVLLVPTHAFTDRETQHRNVIAAATDAGVGHLVYTPIHRKPGSTRTMPQVTEPDRVTEEALRVSGLRTTILRHPPFLENFEGILGPDPVATGVRVPDGDGHVAAASRDDLAEAQAVVLTDPDRQGRTHVLLGGPPVSFDDIAETLSEIHGTTVRRVPVAEADHLDELVAAGLPRPGAEFALSWIQAMNAGEWDEQPGDLESLLGRPPTTTAEFLRATYPASTAGASAGA
jgi:NAD(P)H dehydrogenase (quinone)